MRTEGFRSAALAYRRGLLIRAWVAGVFGVFFLAARFLGGLEGISGFTVLIVTLAALVGINVPLWWVGAKRGFPQRDFYLHWGMDLCAVSVIVYSLGTLDLPLAASAYMIMIVSSATFGTMLTAWCLAMASSLMYVTLWLGEAAQLIPHQHVVFASHMGIGGQMLSVGGAVIFFHLFALLGGTLAGQLRRRADEIETQRLRVQDSYAKEQAAREGLMLLSAVVQHDVYSPLGVVANACEEAIRSCDSGDSRGARTSIRIVRDRLKSIESAVASLTSLGQGPEANERGEENLQEIVARVVDDLNTEARDRMVSVAISGDWPTVGKAATEIYHVLRNLLANAIKCVAEDGTGRVQIGGTRVPEYDGWIITVSDNGPGMPSDVGRRLNAPLSLRLGTRTPDGGFGAGLMLSRNLAERWGGSLTYEPGVGGGAQFMVRVPAEILSDSPTP